MYDIIRIHMTSHPIFMISHHGMNFIHTVLMSSRPGYLSLHPLQLSYDLQCIENTTSAICVFSNTLYVWHHMNSMWHHKNSLRHHKTVFMTSQPHYSWHHPHCRVCGITNTLLVTSQPCDYGKTPTIFFTLYSVYMTSQMVNEWQRHDCIWHNTKTICVTKPTCLMTSLPMYVWNHTHCTHDTIGTLYGITSTLADNTPDRKSTRLNSSHVF